jgi:hypothetical protein
MLKMRYLSLPISCLIAFACFIPAYGQAKDEKLFAAVPVAQRARFAARLNQYIEYMLTNQQDKLLGLYDEQTLCSMCKSKRKCEEDCYPPMVAQVPEGYDAVLVEFKPFEIKPYKYAGNADFYIEVEQKEQVSWKGKAPHIVKSKVRMFAVYENGDWYFSLVSIGPLIDLTPPNGMQRTRRKRVSYHPSPVRAAETL